MVTIHQMDTQDPSKLLVTQLVDKTGHRWLCNPTFHPYYQTFEVPDFEGHQLDC